MFPSGLYVVDKYNTNYVVTITASSVQAQDVRGTFTITVTPPTTRANNVAPLVVDGGPTGSGNVNVPFTAVTVCVSGTSNCQTIDHVLVDTGSVGLRLLAAGAAGGQLNLPLPPHINLVDLNPMYECAPFVSGFLWGPVVEGDLLTLPDGSGEQASNIEIQVVGQAGQPAPSSCSSSGVDLGTLQALGANGILGIGVFSEDCGVWCQGYWGLPYIYYSCTSAGCTGVSAYEQDQVVNPVSYFASDNQGSVMQLPTPTSGTVQGSLIFGMNTQPNNQIGSAVQLTTDMSGGITTIYQNVNYAGSFLDSGSNGLFFLNSHTLGTQMPTCSDKPGWYCPATTQSFSATNIDINGKTAPATFSVGNADQLFQNSENHAMPTLGTDSPGV
jgi:hypothetical protein